MGETDQVAEEHLYFDEVGLLVIDSAGLIHLANSSASDILGYSPSELCALSLSSILETELAEENSLAALIGRASVQQRLRATLKSGGRTLIELNILTSQIEGNNLIALSLCALDGEATAKPYFGSSYLRAADALEGAGIGIFEIDVQSGTSIVSDTWRRLMEVQANSAEDTQAEWLSRVHPDDLIEVQAADAECIQGRSDRSLTDYRIRRRDDTGWRWMRSNAIAVERGPDGRAKRLIGIQSDITDYREAESQLLLSERQFKSAMENAPIGMALVATDGAWLKVNSALCRFLGYSEEELLKTNFQSLTHADDLAEDVELLEQVLEGRMNSYSIEKRYIRSDGNIMWGLLNVAVVRDSQHLPIHFISQILDISDQRKLERAKREFMATVSHELRTPVTSILGALDLMSLGANADKMQHLLSIARKNGRRLSLLLNDILDYEKLATGGLHLDLVPCDIAAIVLDCIHLNETFASQFSVSFEFTPPDSPVICRVDLRRYEQVVTNLLSNAAKFSPEGGVVAIAVSTVGNVGKLTVADNGKGIDPSVGNGIFVPFAQVDSSSTREKMGTGLGLSISRGFVAQMYGEIGYDDTVRQGATFWVTVPLESSL